MNSRPTEPPGPVGAAATFSRPATRQEPWPRDLGVPLATTVRSKHKILLPHTRAPRSLPSRSTVVRRIDILFNIERPINGKSADEHRAVRPKLSKPLIETLQVYLRKQRTKLSRGHDLAKAIDYSLKRRDLVPSQRVCV